MMGWDKARLAVYLGGLLGTGAAVAAALGWGTYDHATGLFDPPPIDVKALAAWVVSIGGNALAAFALWRGWGRK